MDTSTAPAPGGLLDTKEVQKLINQIMYLSSLASSRQEVEPMLDTLREITARWKSDETMPAADQAELLVLEKRVKKYLVTQDPLRSFSLESLEKRVGGEAGARSLDKNRRSFITVLALSLAAAAVGFFVPPNSLSVSNLILFSIPLFFVVLHIGIAWFYLTSLKNFNQEVRRAFVVICIGILTFALTFSHYAIISAFELNRYLALQYGGVTWLVAAPAIFIFAGLVMYARAIGITSKLMSPLVVAGVAVAAAAIIVVLPHADVTSELYFDFWNIGSAMLLVFGFMGFIIARKISRAVTAAYANPMKWLYRYLFLIGGPTTGLAILASFMVGELQGNALYTVIAVCGITPQILLLYTGYSFKKETSK